MNIKFVIIRGFIEYKILYQLCCTAQCALLLIIYEQCLVHVDSKLLKYM